MNPIGPNDHPARPANSQVLELLKNSTLPALY